MSRIGKSIKIESRLEFARGFGERIIVTANGHAISLWNNENVLKLDGADGNAILGIY